MQQRYIKLNIIRKYRTFITAVLVALYAFIATPIQLWHNHNYKTNTVSEKSSKEKQSASFSKFSQKVADSNCQICSHHYTTFVDVEVLRLQTPFIVSQSIQQYFVFLIPSPPILHFSNKGPPALS